MFKSIAKNPKSLTVLVTGGAGYIGSHTSVKLLEKGYKIVVLDDFSNSSIGVINRIRSLTADSLKQDMDERLFLIEGSILDKTLLEKLFSDYAIDAIIHFAALKAVGESVTNPFAYYRTNVMGTLILNEVAREHGVKNIVYSSSATVYGDPVEIPVTERSEKRPATNPYGQTKAMTEQILSDFFRADPDYSIVLLRYFNPIGAHKSGLIGEQPQGIPNNLLPYIAKVAAGKLDYVRIYGNDYPTSDGTGVRDYIHVEDLAAAHVAALDWIAGRVGTGNVEDRYSIAGHTDENGMRHGVGVFNLGTGQGYSVLEVIHSFEKACGHEIPYRIEPRREGDVACIFANCDKAATELGWKALYDIDRMCTDIWRWQTMNPNGYK